MCDDTLGLFHDDLVAVDNVHALLESAETLTREVIDNHLFVLATEDSLDASSSAFVVEVEFLGSCRTGCRQGEVALVLRTINSAIGAEEALLACILVASWT